LGAVRGSAPRLPAPAASDHGPDLGLMTTSRLHGGAGWWKSPCPDLERARGGQLPRATRQRDSGPIGPLRYGNSWLSARPQQSAQQALRLPLGTLVPPDRRQLFLPTGRRNCR
jgi:hypothetical protein